MLVLASGFALRLTHTSLGDIFGNSDQSDDQVDEDTSASLARRSSMNVASFLLKSKR